MMHTLIPITLLAALTGCAYQPPSDPPYTTQATSAAAYTSNCQEQMRQQRVFMMLATIDLNTCLDRPSNQCLVAVENMKARTPHPAFDVSRVQECFPELKRADENNLIAFTNESIAFQATLSKASKLFDRAAKRGHF